MNLKSDFKGCNLRVLKHRINNDMKWAIRHITHNGNDSYSLDEIYERLDYIQNQIDKVMYDNSAPLTHEEFEKIKSAALEKCEGVNDGDIAYQFIKDEIKRQYKSLKTDAAKYRFLTLIDKSLPMDRWQGDICHF